MAARAAAWHRARVQGMLGELDVTEVQLIVGASVVWLIMTIPATIGIHVTARHQYQHLLEALPREALQRYFELWLPGDASRDRTASFRKRFTRRYVAMHWVRATAFGVFLAMVLAFLCEWATEWLAGTSPHGCTVLSAALGGGVSWVFYDQVVRVRHRDYSTHDVAAHLFRLAAAGPLGLALSAVFQDSLAVSSAFLLGTFPTNTLVKYARRIADRRFALGDENSKETAYSLEALQGISRTQAERFDEERVQSVLQLAYADAIDLTIRTNYDFDYVTDCVSQALLWTYTARRFAEVQALGIRGAVEASNLQAALDSGEPGVAEDARATLRSLSAVLELEEAAARRILNEVTWDPYSEFIVNVWGMKGSGSQRPGPASKA